MFKNSYTLLVLFLWASLSLAQNQPNTVPGQLIIQLQPEVEAEKFDKSLVEFQDWHFEKKLSKHANIWLIQVDDDQFDTELLRRDLQGHRQITEVQYNHIVEMREVPNDPLLGEQWQHVNDNDADMDSDAAWDITTGGTTAYGDEIVVCVIEGANLNHPDLIDNKWVNEGEIPDNGIDDDGNGYVDDYEGWNVQSEDDSGVMSGGHGTQVAGCVGAKGNNELGVVGVNWDVKIMSVAGENLSDEASVIAAYDYALNARMLYNETNGEEGAFVVSTNASWGIDSGDPADIPLWCAFYDTLGTHGILSCGATTNNTSINIDEQGDIPTGCSSEYLFSVTATNQNDVRTTGGYGPIGVDLAAPGAGVYGVSGSSYGSMNGTSFASPHVAGAIALMYSAPCPAFMSLVQSSPGEAALLIRQAILDGTDPVEELEGITVTGGRLNLNNSLLELLNLCSEDDCLAPFGVQAELQGESDYLITWESLNSEVFDLRYREIGAPDWITTENIDVNEFLLSDLQWCTDFEVQLRAHCAGGLLSGWSPSLTFISNGCCEAPSLDSFVVLSEDSTQIELTWQDILPADGYEVGISLIDEGDFLFITVDDNSTTLTELLPCTSYDIVVAPDCDEFALSDVFTITTPGCGACIGNEYCESMGESAASEWIASVEINDFLNETESDNGYGDYTGNSFSLNDTEEHEINLAPGFSGFQYSEYFKVWIDYDHNGEFEETELIFESSESSIEPVSGTFSVPLSATPGITRMRVSMKYNASGSLQPCETFDYGEVEDYCVFLDMTSSVAENERAMVSVYPNPFDQELTVSNPFENADFVIYDSFGRVVMKKEIEKGTNRIQPSGLAPGMYFYSLEQAGRPMSTGKLIHR
ncbi:S8 family serine peptidase [Halocola ammonii]